MKSERQSSVLQRFSISDEVNQVLISCGLVAHLEAYGHLFRQLKSPLFNQLLLVGVQPSTV